ncbi:hypothetical protein SKAU_G00178880 [Synaphobranchus kaupii]|uniref:DDE Tnp4 domain-containing protein n=1 Tax=Synaphobranchus kaupii TaxID=118154 RepID=A0A9Q1FM80_SYNKA|nr:hypothetical protein SKAU_G00178880 [Synaphobranchus kaupii]
MENGIPFCSGPSGRRSAARSDVRSCARAATSEKLYQELRRHLAHYTEPTVEVRILSTLWLLANKECFRGVADRFGVSKGSLHHYFIQVVDAMVALMPAYIYWPSPDQYPALAERFDRKAGFPGVVGCIDGTHIPIKGPSQHRDAYINRKGQGSFQLQAVCDNQLQFTHIFTGNAGSVHDARVYRNSDLKQMLDSNPLPERFYLLGDSAYPLHTNMIVPYTDTGHLTELQKRFNSVHSSTRVHIERAFGLLKCKWRRLHYLDMALLEKIPSVIASTCVLHNFVLINEGLDEDADPTAEENAVPTADDVAAADNTSGAQRRAAEQKREAIARNL